MASRSVSELHRQAFVQVLMANSFMREDDCKALYAQIVNKSVGESLIVCEYMQVCVNVQALSTHSCCTSLVSRIV